MNPQLKNVYPRPHAANKYHLMENSQILEENHDHDDRMIYRRFLKIHDNKTVTVYEQYWSYDKQGNNIFERVVKVTVGKSGKSQRFEKITRFEYDGIGNLVQKIKEHV